MKNLTENQKNWLNFAYVNFGDRGSSTVEAASIGGIAHLTQFKGTDNVHSLKFARTFYNETVAGFSIPATEHSTITSWGQLREYDMISNYLEKFKGYPIIACVMDSYNIFEAVKTITSGDFKEKIESKDYPKFVIRPDSGNAVEIIGAIINIMEENSVKFTINQKGYKVWNKYSIIWGDGINMDTMGEILELLKERGYSSDNMAFGSGGWLMQQHDRDTSKFAIKCSAIKVNNEIVDVFKDPITDHGKRSKKGILSLYKNKKGFFTDIKGRSWEDDTIEALEVVYENGILKREQTLQEIREISDSYL